MAISTSDFINRYAPHAMEQQIKYGIPASVILAQMAIESSWGTSALARNDNNFFGIKKGSSWTGRVSYYDDDQAHEAFRSYDNAGQSLAITLPPYSNPAICVVVPRTVQITWVG